MPGRTIKFVDAIREALDQSLARDPSVYLMGLGVPDPTGVYGSTKGLQEKYGGDRVMDMPTSENAMTGVAIGTAIDGMRPVMSHHRVDFALLAMEQFVNQAAKWHYMFGGQDSVPLVVRMVIGRGWGQGPQHSQSLQSWFAHIPGLKVLMPALPRDAKGLLTAGIEDDNPVIFLEHRWCHNLVGEVPEEYFTTPLGKAAVLREGADLSIIAASYMTIEALHAAQLLSSAGISAEVVDLRSMRPLDTPTILASAKKTGRVIAVDTSWTLAGMSAEILATVSEGAFGSLKCAPVRLGLADCPSPTSPALAEDFFPRFGDIIAAACRMMGRSRGEYPQYPPVKTPHDIPDPSFSGPF